MVLAESEAWFKDPAVGTDNTGICVTGNLHIVSVKLSMKLLEVLEVHTMVVKGL